MKCPNCGQDMQEGHLICEGCGYEIRIVPDFDPNSDNIIDQNTVDDLLENNNEIKDDSDSKDDDFIDEISSAFSIHKRIITVALIIVGALALVGIAVWAILRMNSLDYQLNSVKRQAEMGKYESAIRSLENIYVTHPEECDILFLESEYYQKLSKNDLAIDTLFRIINSDVFDINDIYSAYDKLIGVYSIDGNYIAINDLLQNCEYSEITQAYKDYMVEEPIVSIDSGEYQSEIEVRLITNIEGSIYYTLDGSVPNNTSTKYEGPIFLETGEYTLTCLLINKYGLTSDIVVRDYSIISNIPDEPLINAESDTYIVPILITVEVPENTTVYYTTDKSTPTVESTKYIDPIPMPVGYSNFTFVAIDEDGVSSESVVRSYHLSFPDGISNNTAISLLKDRLVERGLLIDNTGMSERPPGKFTYEVISAIPIIGQGDYYTIREFYKDGSGKKVATDTTYIVEIHQGSTAILGGDAVNGFLAIAF